MSSRNVDGPDLLGLPAERAPTIKSEKGSQVKY